MVVVNPPKDVLPFSIPYVMNEQASTGQVYALRFPVEQMASEVNLGGDGLTRDARVRRSSAGVFEFGNASGFNAQADLGTATTPLRSVFTSALTLVGGTAATAVTGGQAKVSFDLPPIRFGAMTALLSITANPNSGASTLYRGVAAYVIGISTGLEDGQNTCRLIYNATPLISGVSTARASAAPAITSLHWGTGDTGSATLGVGSGGQYGGTFTVVWDQQGANADGATATLTILSTNGS
jgi:hypothetical protein